MQAQPLRLAIFVDGAFSRVERVSPYALSGDRRSGVAGTWKDYPTTAAVKCVFDNSETVEANIKFVDCLKAAPSTIAVAILSPSPSTSPAAAASATASLSTTPVARPTVPATCLSILAESYLSKSDGWEPANQGLNFKPNDNTTEIDSKGAEPVEFRFVAPVSGHYAFTLDMKTSHVVDYNDVWVEFPEGGWTLRTVNSTKVAAGWTKAYHNAKKRSVAAFSVDHDPHAISTHHELVAGQEYVVNVGGRSTMVTLYSAIMFPCEGDNCRIGTYWNNGVSLCQTG